MTVGNRKDPYRAYNFLVSFVNSTTELKSAIKRIENVAAGGFSECSGLESTIEVEELKEGGNNGTVLKFPTRATTTPIQLKRGITTNDDLWSWHSSFLLGKGKRRDGLIVLRNESAEPVKVWAFNRGIPTKYAGPTFNAMSGDVAIEELSITHEGLLLISPSAASIDNLIGTISSSAKTIGNLFS